MLIAGLDNLPNPGTLIATLGRYYLRRNSDNLSQIQSENV